LFFSREALVARVPQGATMSRVRPSAMRTKPLSSAVKAMAFHTARPSPCLPMKPVSALATSMLMDLTSVRLSPTFLSAATSAARAVVPRG